jgi:hypothetical protein
VFCVRGGRGLGWGWGCVGQVRPECEANISFRARWLLKIGTPLGLIYIVVIVWFVHRFVVEALLRNGNRVKPVLVAMCSHGQCPNFARVRQATGESLFCENCARLPLNAVDSEVNHRYGPQRVRVGHLAEPFPRA